jgi:cytoskeletal protein RodZ
VDDLRRRLRETAEAHQPNREEMLVRIQRGMGRSDGSDRARSFRRRKQGSWLKVSLATLAVVGVSGLGGLAVAAGMRQRAPQPMTPAVVAPTGETASATPSPRASTAKPPATASPTPSRRPTTTAKTADGPIVARGTINPRSNIYWAENDLTIDVAQPLTTLTVEIRIAQTGGVQHTGEWRTEPADDFTVTVAPADGFLVYRWTLKPGRTVPALREVFAAQYNHSTGKRDASKDTFRLETTVAGHTFVVGGSFPAGS